MKTPATSAAAALLLCLFVVEAVSASDSLPADVEVVDLKPLQGPDWTPRNLVAGMTSLLGAWNHWYGENQVLIETVPSGAQVSLYYLRSNFQKAFDRAESPALVHLPARIDSTSVDFLKVRVVANGYLVHEISQRVHALPERMLIELKAVPNSLTFLGHTHLAGRTTLTLRTKEEPELRVSRRRGRGSFSLALTQTADSLESRPNRASGYIDLLEVTQLGEDLLLRVKTTLADIEVRSRTSYDPIRREHVLVFDLLEPGARTPAFAEIEKEIGAVAFAPDEPCHAAFEAALRERLDPKVILRAMRPSGGPAELYQRALMERLGRLDRGRVHHLTGETFRVGSPIELAMALQGAGDVKGFLSLSGAVARQKDDPSTFLRSLLAPDLGVAAFEAIYFPAEAAWKSCG